MATLHCLWSSLSKWFIWFYRNFKARAVRAPWCRKPGVGRDALAMGKNCLQCCEAGTLPSATKGVRRQKELKAQSNWRFWCRRTEVCVSSPVTNEQRRYARRLEWLNIVQPPQYRCAASLPPCVLYATIGQEGSQSYPALKGKAYVFSKFFCLNNDSSESITSVVYGGSKDVNTKALYSKCILKPQRLFCFTLH